MLDYDGYQAARAFSGLPRGFEGLSDCERPDAAARVPIDTKRRPN